MPFLPCHGHGSLAVRHFFSRKLAARGQQPVGPRWAETWGWRGANGVGDWTSRWTRLPKRAPSRERFQLSLELFAKRCSGAAGSPWIGHVYRHAYRHAYRHVYGHVPSGQARRLVKAGVPSRARRMIFEDIFGNIFTNYTITGFQARFLVTKKFDNNSSGV